MDDRREPLQESDAHGASLRACRIAAAVIAVAFAVSASSGSAQTGPIWKPAPGTSWQWQLDGELDTSFDVAMYDIDLFDNSTEAIDALHADGRVVVCYFSAGTREDWRPDADDYPEEVLGAALDEWPGERWVDIRRLDILTPIIEARLDLAASKHCDGVEPDNMDAFKNESGFPLSAGDQLTFNRWIAELAHKRGLSVGLKNDITQVPLLVGHFDWAINEQCFEFDECSAYNSFIGAGKAVFGVEYSGDPAVFCPLANAADFDWLKKEPELGAERIACREAYPDPSHTPGPSVTPYQTSTLVPTYTATPTGPTPTPTSTITAPDTATPRRNMTSTPPTPGSPTASTPGTPSPTTATPVSPTPTITPTLGPGEPTPTDLPPTAPSTTVPSPVTTQSPTPVPVPIYLPKLERSA